MSHRSIAEIVAFSTLVGVGSYFVTAAWGIGVWAATLLPLSIAGGTVLGRIAYRRGDRVRLR